MRMMRFIAAWLLLAVCAMVSAALSAADQPSSTDPVWGQYAQVVGRSASAGPRQYELHWRWSVADKELVQEYRNPKDGKVAHYDLITPGPAPGTLVMQSSYLGKKSWDGMLQPDGSVLFIGRGVRKAPHVVGFTADGNWGMRTAKLDDGRIASLAEAAIQYRLAPSAPDAVAGGALPETSVPDISTPMPGPTQAIAGMGASEPADPGRGKPQSPSSPLVAYPSDGSIPELALGQEAAGTLGPASGARGPRGGSVPVGMYRFHGQQGQRVCARVDSADALMHVYLARSPGAAPMASSWIKPHENPYQVQMSRGLMFTLPETGEYYVYSMAHELVRLDQYDRKPNFYRYDSPAHSGSYELKLWDADLPEPPSTLPALVKSHEAPQDGPWIGALAGMLDKPFVDSVDAQVHLITRSGGDLIQVVWNPLTGNESRVRFTATGRRGEFVDNASGRVLQATCGGNTWTVSNSGTIRHHWLRPLRDTLALYFSLPRTAPYAVPHAEFRAEPFTPMQSLSNADPTTIARALELLDSYRAIEAQDAANRARYAAEDRANRRTMASGIAGGFVRGLAEEAGDQQRAQEEFEHALAEGQRQGTKRRAEYLAREGEPAMPSTPAVQSGISGAGPSTTRTPSTTNASPSTGYRSLPGSGTGSWANAGGNSSSAAGGASTRDEASACVSSPVTSRHRCDSLVGYQGKVSNTCSVPVDVRMCFMTAAGWNCQARYGLGPHQSWEPGWCHANTGEVFHSVRYSDSKSPLASP
jgi:hypothetical protein